MNFDVGAFVGVPVTYTRGAFENEFLVSIDSDTETVSGFVRREFLDFKDDERAFLKAEILDVGECIVLKLYGSFFTTNGIEPFQIDWARSNLSQLAA